MLSTVDWGDEVVTKFQAQNYTSEAVTTSEERGSVVPGYLIPYKASLVAIASIGILTNGVTLFGFVCAGRSKMNACSAHIANHTTLELWYSVFTVLRFSMDIAGEFNYYGDSGAFGMAKCILLHGATIMTIGSYGSHAAMVVITLDRYWKIVHPVHHRKYYRQWMLKVGLFLPWLDGIAVNLMPAVSTSGIVNGICYPISFWPTVSMNKAHRLFLFIWQFCVPLVVCIIAYWKIFGVVRRQAQVATERHRTTATTAKGQVAAGTSGGITRGTNAGPTKQEKGAKKEAVAVGSSGQQQTGGLSQAKLNVIRTMAYVLACFIVCFMPRNLYLTYKNLSGASLVLSRRLGDPAGNVVTFMTYCNAFLNPLIYIFQYDVVRLALKSFAQKTAAKFTGQQPPSSN